jgi:GT2 family glycosyltransferase
MLPGSVANRLGCPTVGESSDLGRRDTEPSISVCIATGRRGADLDACLASLAAQRDPPPFELLVCSVGDPQVPAAVRVYFPTAEIAVTSQAAPGRARNILVSRAQAAVLLFLDDDVVVPETLLRRLAELAARYPDVAVFGGPNDTPPGSSSFQVVQGAALACIVGSGPVRRRYGAHPPVEADERWFILCNLAARRVDMLPFADDLVCAEENQLLAEMRRRGLIMRYDPELAVYHQRRPSLALFASQMLKYGRGRGQLLRRDPQTFRFAYGAPVALVLYLAALPFLTWWSRLMLVPLAVYGLAVVAGAASIARTLKRVRFVPLAVVVLATLHLYYGAGILAGVIRSPRLRERLPVRWLREQEPGPTTESA